ncbi:efflux RND transporter periplasmic adaptor subunit [Abyssisolibacter fermentans]|uniref:efflux RND transporter periplasmic adaptor subunit n=1 Tax=Abyssisolibacter fermentans TaxID=1766203 RepID=UPI00082ED4DE|nr:efflux RND transporter periplasmic adaptor subunit [Abyssisolibacter fermentans]
MKIKKLLMIFFIMIPITLAGCNNDSTENGDSHNSIEQTEEAQDNSFAVEVMKVEAKTLTWDYNTIGKLYTSEEVNVSSEMNGKVKNIYFNVGEKVKKGDVLYTLDNGDIKNEVDLQISKLKTNLEDSKIRYENEVKNFNNVKLLYESGSIAKKDYDNAQKIYEQTKLNYEQAQKDLSSNSVSLNSTINDTIIKSPIDGIVSNRNIEIGEKTSVSDFVIVKLDPITAKADVSENVINKISVGDKVSVNVQSQDYLGTIKTISPIGKNNGNMYPVEIEIENENLTLKPGMFAGIYFEIEKMENQIAVPRKSVLSDGDKYYVYIVKDNQPQKVAVEKGITKDGYVQISGELTAGDILIVKGHEYINEESSIKIVNEFTLNK